MWLGVICRAYDVKPSQNDLVDHTDLIAEAVKRDVNLAKSKVSNENLLTFLLCEMFDLDEAVKCRIGVIVSVLESL